MAGEGDLNGVLFCHLLTTPQSLMDLSGSGGNAQAEVMRGKGPSAACRTQMEPVLLGEGGYTGGHFSHGHFYGGSEDPRPNDGPRLQLFLDCFQPALCGSSPPRLSAELLLAALWGGSHGTHRPTGTLRHPCPILGQRATPHHCSHLSFPVSKCAPAIALLLCLPRQDVHTRLYNSWTHGVLGTPAL